MSHKHKPGLKARKIHIEEHQNQDLSITQELLTVSWRHYKLMLKPYTSRHRQIEPVKPKWANTVMNSKIKCRKISIIRLWDAYRALEKLRALSSISFQGKRITKTRQEHLIRELRPVVLLSGCKSCNPTDKITFSRKVRRL